MRGIITAGLSGCLKVLSLIACFMRVLGRQENTNILSLRQRAAVVTQSKPYIATEASTRMVYTPVFP